MVSIVLDQVDVSLGRRRVLEGIRAALMPGSLIGIVGPNGAGKSTLVRAILRLVRPSAGTILLDGNLIQDLRRPVIARALAYLPQGQTVHWPLSVERLVALGRLPHLAPMSRMSAADLAIVEQAMARADVGRLRTRIATELSGGERARVMLARALAVEAPALIADEPLASLDPGHQIDVMELLAQEARSGRLVVAVLHDLTMAARYCDRLLLIDDGRLIADGPPIDVLSSDRLARTYGIDARIDLDGDKPLIVPLGRIDCASANANGAFR